MGIPGAQTLREGGGGGREIADRGVLPNVDDPALHEALFTVHPVPATPPGEDDYRLVKLDGVGSNALWAALVGMLVGLGIAVIRSRRTEADTAHG